jgi:cell division septum initiation protein DivIVA
MPADPVAPPSDGGFTVGRRGYEPQQVDAHLRRLDAEIRILVADRDAAVDQATQLGRELEEARLRADRLRTQVRTMAGRPSDVQGMSERMRTMLRLAEDEVADMLRRADQEVARRLAQADAKGVQVVHDAQQEAGKARAAARAEVETALSEAARLRAETDAACDASRRTLADERTATGEAIAIAAERAEQERARVWAESEARRATVEDDFRIAMDQRRAESLAELDAERARTGEWVRTTRDEAARAARAEVVAADETARRLVAAAQERVAELADLRGRIAAQLRGAHAELGSTLAALAPAALPPAVPAAPGTGALPGVDPSANGATNHTSTNHGSTGRGGGTDARPLVIAAQQHTLILPAPAAPPDRTTPETPPVEQAPPEQPGSDQALVDQPGPAASEARRAPARRRTRRSATGASRR